MTDENKAIIGRQCFVEFEGERQIAEIVDVVESLTNTKIILYCLRLKKGKKIGRNKVELR